VFWGFLIDQSQVVAETSKFVTKPTFTIYPDIDKNAVKYLLNLADKVLEPGYKYFLCFVHRTTDFVPLSNRAGCVKSIPLNTN
jgi:hypothetical protein